MPIATPAAQRGGTLFGVIGGVLLGLVVAALVAVYVSRAPVPFVDRASRGPDPAIPDPRNAPDPNRSLYGRDGAAGSLPSGPVTTAPAPLPDAPKPVPATPAAPAPVPAGPPAEDRLGALVATLPGGGSRPSGNATPGQTTAPTATRYFLQTGSFRVLEDAEKLKVQLTMQGYQVRLQQAEVNGVLVNRVQVGPYGRLDEMNRARSRLADAGMQASVIKQ
jgi:cell division protein FtsN